LPIAQARRVLELAAGTLGIDSWRWVFRLAGFVNDMADLQHPVNHIDVFAHLPSVRLCFGDKAVDEAFAYRRELLSTYCVGSDPLRWVQAIGFLGDSYELASLWTNLCEYQGVHLLCPFLDSRLLGVVLSIEPQYHFSRMEPKWLLKEALCRHTSPELAHRSKLAFGQPIFEWLAPGGQLRPLVDAIGAYDFVQRDVLEEAKARPNWFLYSLLCYDLWHKLFIEKSLSTAQHSNHHD
jgi:hypothetical protein